MKTDDYNHKGRKYALWICAYALVWPFADDVIKLVVYRHMQNKHASPV